MIWDFSLVWRLAGTVSMVTWDDMTLLSTAGPLQEKDSSRNRIPIYFSQIAILSCSHGFEQTRGIEWVGDKNRFFQLNVLWLSGTVQFLLKLDQTFQLLWIWVFYKIFMTNTNCISHIYQLMQFLEYLKTKNYLITILFSNCVAWLHQNYS